MRLPFVFGLRSILGAMVLAAAAATAVAQPYPSRDITVIENTPIDYLDLVHLLEKAYLGPRAASLPTTPCGALGRVR